MKLKLTTLNYLENTMSLDAMLMEYSSKKVYKERCELYGDFVSSLLLLIFDTYLGDDFLNSQQKVQHFNWCWNRVVSNFEKEGFHFESDILYEKFLLFLLDVYYPLEDKSTQRTSKLLKIWSTMFDYTERKSRANMDLFLEYYLKFDAGFNKNIYQKT